MQPDQDTSLAATVDAPPGWRSRFDSRNMLRWESGLAVVVIAIGILGVLTSPEFLIRKMDPRWARGSARRSAAEPGEGGGLGQAGVFAGLGSGSGRRQRVTS